MVIDFENDSFPIIFEGVDRTGKSTLAAAIYKEYKERTNLNWNIVHSSEENKNDFNYFMELLDKPLALYDRHFISEIVYGRIWRNGSKLTEEELDKIVKKIIDKGVVIFYMVASTHCLRERMEKTNEPKKVVDTMYKLVQEYDNVVLELTKKYPDLPLLRINTETGDE